MSQETEATWDEAIADFERLRTLTKSFSVALLNGKILAFRIRLLTPMERDQIQSDYLQRLRRNRGGIAGPEDLAWLKTETILYGVVEGPAGWQTTKENVGLLPAYVRDKLGDAIGNFEDLPLDEATEEAFRRPGERPGVQPAP